MGLICIVKAKGKDKGKMIYEGYNSREARKTMEMNRGPFDYYTINQFSDNSIIEH